MANQRPPLEEAYFTWLLSFGESILIRDKARSHVRLFGILYRTEYTYFVANDENRAMDGVFLREKFLDMEPYYVGDVDWMTRECSFLEMLIALSERADFETDPGVVPDGVRGWLWIILGNLGISAFTDLSFRDGDESFIEEDIRYILKTVNLRTYSKTGHGGLFPLNHSRKNQQRRELWAQLSEYLLENRYVVL